MAAATMKSPFPGMDPYLEMSWPDVHQALCTYARDVLQAQLGPGLVARLEERAIVEIAGERARTFVPDVSAVQPKPSFELNVAGGGGGAAVAEIEPTLCGSDDEPIRESSVQITDARSGGRLVSVVEVLSPSNKVAGINREKYLAKQRELLDGAVSLVEINLVRSGDWIVSIPPHQIPARLLEPYYVAVRRGYDPVRWEYYAMPLRERLKRVRVPLRKGEADAVLDVQGLVDEAYAKGAYFKTIDYSKPCDPPLHREDADWASQFLASNARSGR